MRYEVRVIKEDGEVVHQFAAAGEAIEAAHIAHQANPDDEVYLYDLELMVGFAVVE